MKNSFLVILISLFLGFGCNGNDEVVPRTNPRFSVTYVQEISDSGAEFMANVFEFGSDEIKEYGFVYSLGSNPKLGDGEEVKRQGKPSSPFKLIGSHSMVKGKIYYVAAFIKTDKSTIYSASMSFVSQGSEGFIFEKIEGGPEVYYGDTLTVFGEKFSSKLSNYEVKVNGALATVLLVDESSFTVIIPDVLGFGYGYDYDGKLAISIKILDKSLDVFPDIKFYDPIIYPSDKEFRYEENFYLSGKYLRDENVIVNYFGENQNALGFQIVSVSDTLLVFRPPGNFESLKPELQITLRGKLYAAKESIKIKRTEITKGQQLKAGSIYSHLIIKGDNFNTLNPYDNFFISDVDDYEFHVYEVTPNEIKVYAQTERAVPNPRFFKLWAINSGVKSENFATVENTDASLAYMPTNNFPFDAAADGRSVNWREKAVWILEGKITEVDPKTNSGKVLKTVDLNGQNIASSFALIHQDKIYFAGQNEVLDNTPGIFYSYDLVSGALTELPTIPSKASTPRSVFVSGGYLYFGAGYYKDAGNIQKTAEGYKFNLASKTWSPWDKKFSELEVWDFETTFTHQGDVYGLVNEIVNSSFIATHLMRFDNGIEDWVELAKFPYLGYANGNVAMPIGDMVYIFMGGDLHRLSMDSFQLIKIDNISVSDRSYGEPPFIFVSENKLYTSSYRDYVVYQIDPAYIKQ